jgi:hypothetical protein
MVPEMLTLRALPAARFAAVGASRIFETRQERSGDTPQRE